jgi:hypothetical protein
VAWTDPRTWVAAEAVTATLMNTHVRDNLKAIGDAWTTYTPTTTGLTLGNGTVTAAYTQSGKLVQFRIKFTLGSTSVMATPTFTLPATAFATRSFTFAAGAFDTSASDHYGLSALNTTTTVFFRNGSTALSSTVPFTWATGDELYVSGTYEAA